MNILTSIPFLILLAVAASWVADRVISRYRNLGKWWIPASMIFFLVLFIGIKQGYELYELIILVVTFTILVFHTKRK